MTRSRLPVAMLLVAVIGSVVGCGGGYAIEGRVVRGSMGTVMVVDADDSRLEGTPVAGATIRAIRDPGRLNSRELGSTTSGGDGSFRLRIDSFGAGMLREEWLIAVSRAGTAGAEGIVSLPGSTGRRRLLVTLATGAPPTAPDDRWGSSMTDIMRDFERYR